MTAGEDARVGREIEPAAARPRSTSTSRAALQNAIFDSVDFSRIATDAAGVIQLFSVGAERMLGYTAAEVVDRFSPADLSDPADLVTRAAALSLELGRAIAPGFEALAYKASHGIEDFYELTYVRKDGSRFPAALSVTALRDAHAAILGYLLISSDDTARKQAEERRDARAVWVRERDADEARFHLAAIVDSCDDAIIGTTLTGIVASWNQGAQRIFGYASAEMVGQPIARLVPNDRVTEEASVLERLAKGERVPAFDTVRVCRDGREVPVSVTISPIRDSTGTLIGASKIVQDITERREAALRLTRARDAADAASRELESFSYAVAHDLRAPLRGMNGFAQVLLDHYGEKLDAEGKDWLAEIVLNAQKMGALIDALLSLSRLTRNELQLEVVDLSSLVRAAMERLRAAEPGRVVESIVEDHLTAVMDPSLARALVENLVANAWKFTSRMLRARIEFGSVRVDGAPTFFVRDDGAGFDMAYANRLFGHFQRLHTAAEFPGTGIGLATVQRIVHRHGGRVWAEGVVNGGATFYFTVADRAAGVSP